MTDSSVTTDFPTLPTRKPSTAPKARRSMKPRTSRPEVVGKLENGNYYSRREIFVRPFLSCWCIYCYDQSKNKSRPDYIREEQWEMCEKARTFGKGTICKVTDSKIVRHHTRNGEEKFSIAKVKFENGVRGWVRSKNLKQRKSIRSESVLRNMAREEYIERSRTPSVCSSGSSFCPPLLFQLGEVVLCRNGSGEWVQGEVQNEIPLLVLAAGSRKPCPFAFKDLKKVPTRKFRALEDVDVRSCKTIDNWKKTTLKKGTIISVAYVEGFEGRITGPVVGWISMRNKHSLNVVEQDYTPVERTPTLLINGIPSHMTEMQLIATLQQNAYFTPESIVFQKKGEEFRAVVEPSGHSSGVDLVELGEVILDGIHRLTFRWEMNYLRSFSTLKN